MESPRDGTSGVRVGDLDATACARVDRDRQENHVLLRQVVESLPIVLVSLDAETRKPVLLTGAVHSLFGYEPRRFLDEPNFASKIIHPEDVESVRTTLEESLSAKRAFDIEFRVA